MRTMYDSVTPTDIPLTARMVAGYADGVPAWPAAGWSRFWAATQVRIVLNPAHYLAGDVLDVERGSANPDQAPGWVDRARRWGVPAPAVYCSLALWPTVRAEFDRQGVAPPLWWIAHYTGKPPATLPPDVIAIQYANPATGSGGHFDLSAVADYWPGVDPAPTRKATMGTYFRRAKTGETAILLENGDFIGAPVPDGVPYATCPDTASGEEAWADMASRLDKRLAQLAVLFTPSKPTGGSDDAGTVPVDLDVDGVHYIGRLTKPSAPPSA